MDTTIIWHEIQKAKSFEDVKQINAMLRTHWRFLRGSKVAVQMDHSQFPPGAYVKFRGKKNGPHLIGKVGKINRTTVGVDVPGYQLGWRVSPSYLKPATQEEYEKFSYWHAKSSEFMSGED